MSQQMACLQRALEVFEAEGFEAWLEQFVAPDALFIQHASVLAETQIWLGWEGWRVALATRTEDLDDWGIELHEVFDLGGDRVVVTWSDHGRARRSGVQLHGENAAFVHTVRDGKIVQTVQYGRAAYALQAVGLAE